MHVDPPPTTFWSLETFDFNVNDLQHTRSHCRITCGAASGTTAYCTRTISLPIGSGVAPANQTKERSVHELFTGAFRNESSMWIVLVFLRKKHQNSQNELRNESSMWIVLVFLRKNTRIHKNERNSWTFRFGSFFGLVCRGDSWLVAGLRYLSETQPSWRHPCGQRQTCKPREREPHIWHLECSSDAQHHWAHKGAQWCGRYFDCGDRKGTYCLPKQCVIRGQKLNTNLFFSNFSGTTGVSQRNPGISRQKSLTSLVSRDIPNFLAPTPSCGRPLPHRKISGLKSLGLGSWFVSE